MNWKKFEYFLNAVLYCIWLYQQSFQNFIHRIVYAVISVISKILFTREYRERFYMRQAIGLELWDKYRNDPKVGWNIGMAARNFSIFCALYPFAIALILMGVSLRYSIKLSSWTIVLVGLALMALFYIPVNKMVYNNDKYLKYFKKFKNEDISWLRKWKRITVAFCICSIMTLLGGLALTWIILIG